MKNQDIIGLWEAYQQVHTQEEVEQLDEGMTLPDYKKKRSALKQKEKRAAAATAPTRRAGIHTPDHAPERAARHRFNVDPDFEGNDEENYPGGKLKNPKKIRKAKALGELGEGVDLFDYLLEYLVAEGYADTNKAALAIMANMSEEWKESIVEQEGFRRDGRYQLPDGSHMGPIPGAIRALFTGNLPKSRTYVPPSTQTPTNRAPSIPASKGDDGQLTDFGKGGGKEKMKRTGMTVGQVERLGRRNMGDYSN